MRRTGRIWVHECLSEMAREPYEHYTILMNQLKERDAKSFQNFTRMDPDFFDQICNRIAHRISKHDTNYRKAISPGLKLAVTRHLPKEDKCPRTAYDFRVHISTICLFIPEVCHADEVIKCPTTPEECKEVSLVFEQKWNIPHAVSAKDCRHVAMFI